MGGMVYAGPAGCGSACVLPSLWTQWMLGVYGGGSRSGSLCTNPIPANRSRQFVRNTRKIIAFRDAIENLKRTTYKSCDYTYLLQSMRKKLIDVHRVSLPLFNWFPAKSPKTPAVCFSQHEA
jgi:hypothetical protein